MADLLEKVREEQIKLVEKYMQETLPEDLPRIKRMNEMLKTGEFDPDALRIFVQQEIRHDAILALHGFAEWTAAKIIRSKNFNKQPIPRYTDEDLQKIADRYNIDLVFVKWFIPRLILPGTVLPMLGQIGADGELIPNKKTLKKWAKLFDWSAPAK